MVGDTVNWWPYELEFPVLTSATTVAIYTSDKVRAPALETITNMKFVGSVGVEFPNLSRVSLSKAIPCSVSFQDPERAPDA